MAVWMEVRLSQLSYDRRLDPEFYRPEDISADSKLSSFLCRRLGNIASVTDGEHGSVPLSSSGIRYLTAENIQPGYITVDSVRFVDEWVHRRNARAAVRPGDILISIKGTLGQVAVAESWLPPANMNRDVAIVKMQAKDIIPEYIAAFLLSRFGQYQALREGSGGVQQMITLGRLRTIRIPVLKLKAQNSIAVLWKNSLNKRNEANRSYECAVGILNDELGLDKLKITHPLGYEAKLSETRAAMRFDGEYFKPSFRQVVKFVINYHYGYEPLLRNVQEIRLNVNPSHQPEKSFQYVELADINASLGLVMSASEVLGKEAPSRARRKIIADDVIVSSVAGSIDKAALVGKKYSGALASTGFFQFRSDVYDPRFLLVLLRCKLTTMQLKREATGGILSAVGKVRLRHVVIPTVPREVQEEVARKAGESHAAYREAEGLLSKAKCRVEELIEQESK